MTLLIEKKPDLLITLLVMKPKKLFYSINLKDLTHRLPKELKNSLIKELNANN